MSSVLPVDILLAVVEYVDSKRDLSLLSRCNHTIHAIVIPRLYHNIEISVKEITFFANSMESNSLFRKHCNRLSVTFEDMGLLHSGETLKAEYRSMKNVIDQCLERGGLTDLTWDTQDYMFNRSHHLHVLRDGERLEALSQNLKSLDLNLDGWDPECRLTFLALTKCSFSSLTSLRLQLYLKEQEEYEALWLFLSSLPSLQLLGLDTINMKAINDHYIEGKTIVPNVILRRLESLRVSVIHNVSAELYSDSFLDDQSSLKELEVGLNDIRASSTLKGLFIRYPEQGPPEEEPAVSSTPTLARRFSSLAILRLHTWTLRGNEWSAFVNAIPKLKCLEISCAYGSKDPVNIEVSDCHDFLSKIKAEIIEFGIIYDMRRCQDFRPMLSECASFERVDKLLECCSKVASIRSLRISLAGDKYGFVKQKMAECDLPEEHDLDNDKIPQALEYVLWEFPWKQRLYRVSRGTEGVKLVYTGYAYLPGRPHYSTLTWSNDSIYDHVVGL